MGKTRYNLNEHALALNMVKGILRQAEREKPTHEEVLNRLGAVLHKPRWPKMPDNVRRELWDYARGWTDSIMERTIWAFDVGAEQGPLRWEELTDEQKAIVAKEDRGHHYWPNAMHRGYFLQNGTLHPMPGKENWT